nr:right-handed parallel beta-helix repeat-containing protein [Halomarina oriensis]
MDFGGDTGGDFNSFADGGLDVREDYWTVSGITVRNSPYVGFLCRTGTDMVVEDCVAHDCAIPGFYVISSAGTTVRNCTSYDNTEDAGNADGFQATSGASDVLFEGCAAYGNGDDGFDLFEASNVTLRACRAHDNGIGGDGNGYKLGGEDGSGNNTVEQCLAYRNPGYGIGDNMPTGNGRTYLPVTIRNCTVWNNTGNGVELYSDVGHEVSNTLAWNNASAFSYSNPSTVTENTNSWTESIGDPLFADTSVDASGVPTDPATFLTLSAGSPAIDAGTAFDETFVGSAPEIGAKEFPTVRLYDATTSAWVSASVKTNDGSGWS